MSSVTPLASKNMGSLGTFSSTDGGTSGELSTVIGNLGARGELCPRYRELRQELTGETLFTACFDRQEV